MTDYLGILNDLSPLIVGLVMLGFARSILRRDIKGAQIASVFQQLGIKKFDPSALNADKLDDKGFQRLCTVLQLVSPSAAKAAGGSADMTQLLQILGAAGQMRQGVAGATGTGPQQ